MKHTRQDSATVNRVLIAALIALVLILLTAPRAYSQQHAQVAFSGGVATDQRGVRSNAVSLAPSAAWQSTHGATFSLGGNLTQFQQDAFSLGGWAGLSHRDRFAGPFSLMIDASASGSRLAADRSSASFLTGEVVPALGIEFGSLSFFGGARAASGRVSQNVNVQRPIFPGLGRSPGTTSATMSMHGAGPTFGADYATLVGSGRVLRLGAREDRLLIEGVTIADRTATLTTAKGALTLSGQFGRRYASDENDSFGGVALSLGVDRRGDVALHVAAGEYPSNRLTGSLAGRYLNAGFSFRLAGSAIGGGDRDTHAPGPRERGAPSIPPGYVRLTIDAPGASQVEVAGDFNEWVPVRASRAPNGVWYADLVIKPGQYRYAFRVNGRDWRVPRGATAVDDGFGGKSAWLTVRGS